MGVGEAQHVAGRGDEQEKIRTGLDAVTSRNPYLRTCAKVDSNHGAVLRKQFRAVAASVREIAAPDGKPDGKPDGRPERIQTP